MFQVRKISISVCFGSTVQMCKYATLTTTGHLWATMNINCLKKAVQSWKRKHFSGSMGEKNDLFFFFK